MNDIRRQRLQALRQLLRSESLSSQEEVQARLGTQGVIVTQATVSRDLERLGAVKVRRSGRTVYAIPEESTAQAAPSRLQAIVREWVRSAEAVGNMVIVKTPPGSAHLVGVSLDDARLPAVAGTICGDDTIFVAVREAAAATELAAWLSTGAADVR